MAGVNGRVALVTGAGRGIGRATAELLASRGARVVAVARTEQELAALGLEYVVADLGTPEGCAMAVTEAEQRFGSIEIFVWSETMRVNLDGPFHLSRLLLPGMIERKYGRVVYTSSTAGEVAEFAGSAYNSSKHGLLGLMRSVALDAGPHGITSNAVLPGWVRTEMAECSAKSEAAERGISTDQVWEERAAMYPPGRVATPQEVAEMIAFLASEESSGVSGEAIRVALGSIW